ncbi:LytR/AlgR family response regulator transcription factor [Chondrinema litorale]|uniref:LytR/AlgR family response regulator transcription factor n=1 Tax=Chondrinema litorale TaxID=2994555 RepID=UPI002542F4DA|nr:LytTR family DNA-binding domain-containing protein [Chondrinema litorale]UZR99908.1 LytTR family DNA-binding domain-containing protein [Chondrinema litorale]
MITEKEVQVIVVDDEKKSRESLVVLLSEFCKSVQVLGSAGSVKEGLKLIEEVDPDIVFLDIQMNSETGFDLLRKSLPTSFEVIFTTAHSEYAIEAIKFSALDYLLKPIDIQELQLAVSKYRKKSSDSKLSQRLETLIDNFKNTKSESFKMALSTSDGLIFVNLSEIVYLEADGSYTMFYLKNGEKHLVTKNLKEYETLLAPKNFFRIHNSFVINLGEIVKYVRGEGGYVVMTNGKSLDVSKRKKQAFLSKIHLD